MSEVTSTLIMTAFRFIIAAGIIIVVVDQCTGRDVSSDSFSAASKAINELSDTNTLTDANILLDENQFGIFFEQTANEFAQIIDECWIRKYFDGVSVRYNPENNCLYEGYTTGTNPIIRLTNPIIVEKPNSCIGDCFCIFTVSDNGLEVVDVPTTVDGKTFTQSYKKKITDSVCQQVQKKPSLKYELKQDDLLVRVYERTVRSVGEGPIETYVAINDKANERVKNFGGAVVVPSSNKLNKYYFGIGNDGGFIVCKNEDQCSNS